VLELILMWAGLGLAAAVIAMGMTSKWRLRRTEYYTMPTVLSLIAAFAGAAAALFSHDLTAVAIVAVCLGGWIAVEAVFAVTLGKTLGAAPEPVVAEEEPAPVAAPVAVAVEPSAEAVAAAVVRRARPQSNRGPQPKRRGRR
jgi:hypothetical protein